MSRILFSGDWHLAVSTLDRVERVTDEVLSICKENHVTHFVHLGDLKSDYSPIDGRVFNAAIKIITKIKRLDVEYLQLQGNHDRYNLFTSVSSWLPVLRKAGALTFDTPGLYQVHKDYYLAFLPYTNSDDEFKRSASHLAKSVKGTHATLVFHKDIKGARYNALRKESGSDLDPKVLHPEAYDYCIGGDIHFQQEVRSNVWYAGSPYPVDNGEANQFKGYILIDTQEGTFDRIFTNLPRLFDVDQPGFQTTFPRDGNIKGHTIRAKVLCRKDDDIQEMIELKRKELEEQYEGAIIEVRHTFGEHKYEDEVHDLSVPNDKRIKRYLRTVLPAELREDKDRIYEYIWHRLREAHVGARQKDKIKFLWAEGRNVLSFKRIRVDFRTGVTLITGDNRDWGKRSNGSGKTSYLSLLAIAGWGRTFKGQLHDAWAKRGTKSTARAAFAFENSKGDRYKVVRTRRPAKLKLFKQVDGKWKNFSAGNKVTINQRQIEELTGYTWETIAAGLYVDQKSVNSLLTGTDSDRKKILTRVQNTERYTVAQDHVKKDLVSTADFETEIRQKREIVKNRLKTASEHFDVVRHAKTDEKRLKGNLTRNLQALQTAKERFSKIGVDKRLKLAKSQVEDDSKKLYIASGSVQGQLGTASRRLKALTKLGAECPTCEQSVPKSHVREIKARLVKEKATLRDDAIKFRKELDECNTKLRVLSDEINKVEDDIDSSRDYIARLETKVKVISYQINASKVEAEFARVMNRKRKRYREELRWLTKALKGLLHDKAVFEFCSKVLSKDGLPAFLNSYLCPLLNDAADIYSDLLGDGYLKVRFDVEEGDFVVSVSNPHGGEQRTDQSLGEERTASYITSFAARDVMTPCNLMMLDEPGEGLDFTGARQFAQRLKEVASRIGCVLVTSHRQEIIAELDNDNHVVVRKRNGTSRIIT